MLRIFALLLLALVASFGAEAQTQTARPIYPPGSGSQEPRYLGVDFPAHTIIQSITSTGGVYLRRNGSSGAPLCVPWETIASYRSEQSVCVCYVQSPSQLTLSGPGSAGGCQITDGNGPDGTGACFVLSGGAPPVYRSPAWQSVANRPGARLGACSVATSTTVSLGAPPRRPPCGVTSDCTTVVGSGTCDLLAGAPNATDVRYGQGCAYVLARGAATGLMFVEVVR
jgi:hypothetical protein